jgi:hypothetical protein
MASPAITERRAFSHGRLHKFAAQLGQAEGSYGSQCCVYATGSYGRGEASRHSDLDVFIVGVTKPRSDASKAGGESPERALNPLDETCLKSDLIRATRALELPEFSGNGEYLQHYTDHELAKAIGAPNDDHANTFTARLLMLLESQPIFGQTVYEQAIATIIDAYCLDYDDHADSFEPVFLVNDILRLWRTFCVNYEHRTRAAAKLPPVMEETPEKKAKRKLKHYKLTHSRMLTCYSAIASLLETFSRQRRVSKDDIRQLVSERPLDRLAAIGRRRNTVDDQVNAVVDHYAGFLQATDASEKNLIAQFQDREFARQRASDARTFGQLVFNLVRSIDSESRLFQTLVV